MTQLKEFTMSSARPLPVLLLADISGSMASDGKIQSLNHAMREMISTFAQEDDLRAEIHVGVVTFGGAQAQQYLAIGPAKQVTWSDLPANGSTPMGSAFRLATQIVEDRALIPSRAYRPTVVLLSDGQPTDEWKASLDTLLKSERGGKAFRMALAVGADADENVLKAFLNDPEARVFRADEARQIRQFFRLVTMSVTSRSRSQNPNAAPPAAAVGAKLPADEGWDL